MTRTQILAIGFIVIWYGGLMTIFLSYAAYEAISWFLGALIVPAVALTSLAIGETFRDIKRRP